MSRISTISQPPEMVLIDAGGVTMKGKLTASGGVSLVRVTSYDSGPSRCFDLPPEALPGLAILIADALARRPRGRAKPVCPAGMTPEVHEALLAASGQSDLAEGRA